MYNDCVCNLLCTGVYWYVYKCVQCVHARVHVHIADTSGYLQLYTVCVRVCVICEALSNCQYFQHACDMKLYTQYSNCCAYSFTICTSHLALHVSYNCTVTLNPLLKSLSVFCCNVVCIIILSTAGNYFREVGADRGY